MNSIVRELPEMEVVRQIGLDQVPRNSYRRQYVEVDGVPGPKYWHVGSPFEVGGHVLYTATIREDSAYPGEIPERTAMVVFDGEHHQGPLLGSVGFSAVSAGDQLAYTGSGWWPGSRFVVTIRDSEYELGPDFDIIDSGPEVKDGAITYRASRHEKLFWRFKTWKHYEVTINKEGEHQLKEVA